MATPDASSGRWSDRVLRGLIPGPLIPGDMALVSGLAYPPRLRCVGLVLLTSLTLLALTFMPAVSGAPTENVGGLTDHLGLSPGKLATVSFDSGARNVVKAPQEEDPGTFQDAASVVRTLFPGYNTTVDQSFTSAVSTWDVGTPAFVPTTGSLWFPQLAVSVSGYPSALIAPAAIYNLTTMSFESLDLNLSNATAFAYDPGNQLLYATEAESNSVQVVDPRTGDVVAPEIPVGERPEAIAFDASISSMIVANSGSDNLTVIDTLDNQVSIGNVPVGGDPVAIVYDSQDGFLFVANGGSNFISVLSADDPSDTLAEVTLLYGPALDLSLSSRTDNLVATIPTSGFATIINAETKTVVTSVVPVGKGYGAAITSQNGSEFVIGNESSGSLAVLNASFGTIVDPNIAVDRNSTELVDDTQTGEMFCWSSSARVLDEVNLSSNSATPVSPSTSPQLVAEAYSNLQPRVFVADGNGSQVYVIDPSHLAQKSPSISSPSPVLSVVTDSVDDEVYVGTTEGVEVYNASTDMLVGTIAGLDGANTQLVIDESTNFLWLSNSLAGVEAVNLSSGVISVETELTVSSSSTNALAVDSLNSEVFVLVSSSAVAVLNSRTGDVVESSVTVGSNVTTILYDPVDGQVYAGGDEVSMLSASSLKVDASPIQIGAAHKVLSGAFDSSRSDVFLTISGLLPGKQGVVAVIDGSSISESEVGVSELPVGEQPDALVVVPSLNGSIPGTSTIWVANELSGTISIIASPPEITYFAATPRSVDLGYPTSINVTYVGGAGQSLLKYFGLPPGCDSIDTSPLNCSPTAAGDYTIFANVTDSFGEWVNDSTTLVVNRALGVILDCPLSTFPFLDPGVPLDCSAAASNGLSPYSYSWSFSDGATYSGANVSHIFSTPGVYTVSVLVRDSTGATNLTSTSVDVVTGPVASVSASPGNVTDVGVPISFAAAVEGGTGALTQNWTFGDGSRGFGENATHAWTRPGNYTVSFTYVDLLGVSTNRSMSVSVQPSLAATFSSDAGSPSDPAATAALVSFTCSISGGSPPYTVSWSFGDGSQASGISASHRYATSGTYPVVATVVDHVGGTITTNFSVVVTGSSSGGGGLPSLAGGFGAGIFLGFLVGGVAAAVILYSFGQRKGRRPRDGPVSPYVPP